MISCTIEGNPDYASIISDRHRAIGIERHTHLSGIAAQGLVDGIIDHLIDHMVQARAVVRVANIHARTLTHRVQALENLDGCRAVVRCLGICLSILAVNGDFRFFAHRSSAMVKDPAST